MKPIDRTGQRVNDFLVISRVTGALPALWNCECICGTRKVVSAKALGQGIRGCGCFVPGSQGLKHGYYYTPEYKAWASMLYRCSHPNSDCYAFYGGRGIKVCEEWKHDFMAFLRDMGKRPEGRSLDRIDNNGDYEPSNCRWATTFQQNANRRCCNLVSFQGESLTVPEWSRRTGIDVSTLRQRLRSGCPVEKVFSRRRLRPGERSQ